jgi:hypothetical protein
MHSVQRVTQGITVITDIPPREDCKLKLILLEKQIYISSILWYIEPIYFYIM